MLIFALLLAGSAFVTAQGIDEKTAGRTYVLAFPDTTQNAVDPDPPGIRTPQQDTFIVAIYSAKPNDVTITGNGGYSKTVSIAAGGFETVYLNGNPRASTPVVTESGVVSNKTFRIEAAEPIVVYCFMVTKFGTEAFTPIPVENWGKEHYAAALPGEIIKDYLSMGGSGYRSVPKAAPSEILVVAAFDNTSVTIVPNGRLETNPPTTVTLRKNQCYQVQSYVDTNSFNLGVPQPDLGGSHIYSSKPVGVISGNTRSQVLDQGAGLTKNSYKNLMIEWIPPVEQQGTEFVYLPTSDSLRPTGTAGENPAWKRQGEILRIYGTAGSVDDEEPTGTEGVVIEGRDGYAIRTFNIDRTKFYEALIGAPVPHVVKTDKPAQAFMNSSAVIRFVNGSETRFDAWGPYMVEVTPREQWPSVAPYVVPDNLGSAEHFVNIVTSEASRARITIDGSPMVIDRKIAGTDLWWGTRKLAAGARGVIAGADAKATFYAFVYGGKYGFEYTTNTTYRENIAQMYGYPLAPRRQVLRPADSLRIDTLTIDCSTLRVRVRTINANPSGLRLIGLDSARNARLVFNDPVSPEAVLGVTKAEVEVRQIDSHKDASGVVVIQDRTGREWRIPYSYVAPDIDVTPTDVLDFGQVTLNTKSTKVVTIVNRQSTPMAIDTLYLALETESFTILSTKPMISFDPLNHTVLAPGDTLFVTIETFPTIQDKHYEDTLKARVGCARVNLLIRTETVQPPAGVDEHAASVAGYHLDRIEPNPASSTATIAFTIGRAGETSVEIFDARGVHVATVANKNLDAGEYRMQWSGERFPSGVYYFRIVSGAWSVTRPVLLMR